MSKKEDIRGSFLHIHMVRALLAEPDWTPQMYAVYNDLEDDTTKALVELWNEPNHGVKNESYP